MKRTMIAAVVGVAAILGAQAQTSTTAPTPSPNAPADANAPLPGANSFTEGQAKSRLEANGYTAVSELKKDDNGVWKGRATHDGQPVNVSVDYRGNITRN
nr:PepSY domain-containing protein [Bosea sp. BIWAKO-01]